MAHANILATLKKQKLAAQCFEKTGHHQFRDCVTFCVNGKVFFQRFCYGEAAGLVCSMWGSCAQGQNIINWDYDACPYSKKTQAPTTINLFEEGSLFLDGKQIPWQCSKTHKYFAPAGLGFFKMLFK